MASSPDISIVVPTRNRAPLLHRLLSGLFELDGDLTYEIIVVDEASSDDTAVLLERLRVERGIRVLRHDRPKGPSVARNAGTEVATAPYVAWIDDDDLTSPDRLRRQHAALVTSGRRWSCAGRIDIDDNLQIVGHVRCPPEDGLLASLLRFNTIPAPGQGLLVERELALSIGGYDPSLFSAEDWDFCIRLTALAEPHLLDEPLVGYRTGMASLSADTRLMERAVCEVTTKHVELQRSLGVQPDWTLIHRSLLAADLLHSRRSAARRALKILRFEPTPRNVARFVAVAAAPRWVASQSAARRRAQVPAAWHTDARRWLDAIPDPYDA